ncbi:MAG: PilZ domain-containing protein [Solirubrobacteraceae bacterium]
MTPGLDSYDISRAIWLPAYADPVTLFLSSGEKFPARVVERRERSLLVAIMVPIERLDRTRLDGLVLEYANPGGRVLITGEVTVEQALDGELLRIDDAEMIEVLQERAHARVNANCPILIRTGRKCVESNTVDLSAGGLLLAGPKTLEVGEEIEFELTITPGSLPITGTANVVRVDTKECPAIQFTSISASDRWRLIRFTLECQRAEQRLRPDR